MAVDGSGEREILIKAVRVNTLSKLTYGDTRQFLALIGDVFPGAESSDIPGVRKAKSKAVWCSARLRGIRRTSSCCRRMWTCALPLLLRVVRLLLIDQFVSLDRGSWRKLSARL